MVPSCATRDLDTGVHPGWARTGYTFLAIKAGEQVAGSTPICRFHSHEREDTRRQMDVTDARNGV